MNQARAGTLMVEVDPDAAYEVQLKGRQLKFLIDILGEVVIKGRQSHLHASILDVLQEPLISEAAHPPENGRAPC